MTTFKVKWGDGTQWKTMGPGDFKGVKWGTVWYPVGRVKIKWGSSWYDTGYLGYPSTPAAPTLYDYGYDASVETADSNNFLTIRWTKPPEAVQADITHYDVRIRNASGGTISMPRVAEAAYPMAYAFRNLSWDTGYQFDVRAIAAGGLVGAFSPVLRRNTGHPATTTTTVVTKTRSWDKSASVNMYRDQVEGVKCPTDVTVNKIRYNLQTTFATGTLSDAGSNREFYRVVQGQQVGGAFNWGNPVNTVFDIVNQNGEGKIFGGILRGIGWSTEGVSTTWRVTGTITAYGTETYKDTETVTNPAKPPYAW